MNPAQLALQETRAKVPENSVSTPFTYLVQLHLVGREVILPGVKWLPRWMYSINAIEVFDSTQSREADWMGLTYFQKHFTYVFSGAV